MPGKENHLLITMLSIEKQNASTGSLIVEARIIADQKKKTSHMVSKQNGPAFSGCIKNNDPAENRS